MRDQDTTPGIGTPIYLTALHTNVAFVSVKSRVFSAEFIFTLSLDVIVVRGAGDTKLVYFHNGNLDGLRRSHRYTGLNSADHTPFRTETSS